MGLSITLVFISHNEYAVKSADDVHEELGSPPTGPELLGTAQRYSVLFALPSDSSPQPGGFQTYNLVF